MLNKIEKKNKVNHTDQLFIFIYIPLPLSLRPLVQITNNSTFRIIL